MPIVDFVPIIINLPEHERNSLSSDEKYFLDICTAVSTGFCLPDLALRNPGKLNHARWVTIANKILRCVPEVQSFPCHTQGVERCIKLVTEASVEVCGYDGRDGYIRARFASRQIMPSFNTKSQFQTKKILFDA